MSRWLELKASARSLRFSAEQQVGPGGSLEQVLNAALSLSVVEAEPCPFGDPLLHGGDARLEVSEGDDPVIFFRSDAALGERLFLIAHELAHFCLHAGSFSGVDERFAPDEAEEVIPESSIEPYSPRSFQERQANVWAREFLLPAPALRIRFLATAIRASDIAKETGLDSRLVVGQMARALLTVEPDEVHEDQRTTPVLNDRQLEAARALTGPLLVMAGPGTGKTSTLAARVSFLLDSGKSPDEVVCLTFSRKAAQEMRERIAARHPEEATLLRIDTIHAYCCDILRTESSGETDNLKILDPPRARAVLESLLPSLPLVHFQYLPDPPARLGEILKAIDRAKCDLIGPAEFMRQAEDQLQRAQERNDDEAIWRAEKVMEVAIGYCSYQDRLDQKGYCDYSDLILQAIRLLEERPDVLSRVRGQKHVLVDEYQDLNAAGLRFIELLAGAGERLWAVGDPCQAIYRFRGASTAGILGFQDQYPAAPPPIVLDVNYRSRQEIVDFFGAMPPMMDVWKDMNQLPRWVSDSGTGGRVTFRLAEAPDSELVGVARAIGYHQSQKGVAYRDQAILSRNHKHLAQIARALEAEGVPILFLTGFFERDVVRDLLSLIELTTGTPRYHALLHVSAFPEYAVPEQDIHTLVVAAQDVPCSSCIEALSLVSDLEGISPEGRRGLLLLLSHVQEVAFADHPWPVLTNYLFETSRYLDTVPPDDDQTEDRVLNQRRRVAIFQLLQIAHGYTPPSGAHLSPRWAFLEWVRRLALSSEYRHLAQVPSWAASIDAVRLMTVHAAKGLEFEAVYIPMLNEHDFETTFISDPVVSPDFFRQKPYEASVIEEEQCLFFVAASRARRFLVLSRSMQRYNFRGRLSASYPAGMLTRLESTLLVNLRRNPHWVGRPPEPPPPDRTPLEDIPTYSSTDLEEYVECPRRYYYGRLFKLHPKAEPSPYLTMVGLVRDAMKEIQETLTAERPLVLSSLIAEALQGWDCSDFKDHFYASHYRRELTMRISRLIALLEDGYRTTFPTFDVLRPKGRITLAPDMLVFSRRGHEIRRWTAGSIHWSEEHRPYYWLLQQGARNLGIANPILQAVSAASGQIKVIRVRQEMADIVDGALDGLAHGEYPPRPDDSRCPACPFYFACNPKN